jgi:hypothetical protein
MDKARDNSFNPYAPTGSLVYSSNQKTIDVRCLEFDGVIDEDDYAALMPSRFAALLISSIMTFVIFPFFCVLGIAATLFVYLAPVSVMRGQSTQLVVALTGMVVLAVGAFFAGRYFNPEQRVRRNLKRFPDLLGPIRGEITASGLRLEHQGKEHWFGASFVAASHCSNAGIRFRLSDDLYRYLALTRRQFANFDAKAFASIVQQATILNVTQQELPSKDLNACDLFFEQPDDAIPFAGEVSIEIPTRTKQQWTRACVRTFNLIVITAPIILIKNLPVAILCALAVALPIGTQVYQTWRLYFFGKYVQTWNQSGWLNNKYLVFSEKESETRILLSKLQMLERTEERVMLLPFESSHSFCILASNFRSTNDWQRINQILDNELLSRTRSD